MIVCINIYLWVRLFVYTLFLHELVLTTQEIVKLLYIAQTEFVARIIV